MTLQRPGFVLPVLLFAGTAAARDHLVTLRAADERVQAAAVARQADANAVDAVLVRPEARRAIEALGQDPERLRAAVSALSDEELRELALRAQALQADPTAALSGDVNQLLIIFLIVAIVILVLQAVD